MAVLVHDITDFHVIHAFATIIKGNSTIALKAIATMRLNIDIVYRLRNLLQYGFDSEVNISLWLRTITINAVGEYR